MEKVIPNIILQKATSVWHGGKTCHFTSSRFQLVFLASGMVKGGVELPDGDWLYKNDGEITDSRLLLIPPEGSFHGEFYPVSSEYFVFEFDCPELSYDVERRVFILPSGDGSSQDLTPCLTLLAHEVMHLRSAVATIHERFTHVPSSAGLKLAAEMEIAGLMTWLFVLPDCPPSEKSMSPSARLKALIDKDPGWRVPMADMFKKVGRSPQTLRREFRKEFGVTPLLYREQKRRDVAFCYIRATRLPLKVVCERLGMKSPTHLSIYIRRITGMSPRQLRSEAQVKHQRVRRAKN